MRKAPGNKFPDVSGSRKSHIILLRGPDQPPPHRELRKGAGKFFPDTRKKSQTQGVRLKESMETGAGTSFPSGNGKNTVNV